MLRKDSAYKCDLLEERPLACQVCIIGYFVVEWVQEVSLVALWVWTVENWCWNITIALPKISLFLWVEFLLRWCPQSVSVYETPIHLSGRRIHVGNAEDTCDLPHKDTLASRTDQVACLIICNEIEHGTYLGHGGGMGISSETHIGTWCCVISSRKNVKNYFES